MREQQIREFASYLLDGDENVAWDFLSQVSFSSKVELFNELVTPAMRYIGDLWEENMITVADEHIATGVCDFLITRLYPQQTYSPNQKKAMFLCIEGEMHYLGLKMVKILFEENGWNTLYLGPNLPLEYVIEKARAWKPDIIGLSVSIVYHLPQLQKYVNELSRLPGKPRILLGGRMAGKYQHFSSGKHTEIIEDLSVLEDWLKRNRKGETDNVQFL